MINMEVIGKKLKPLDKKIKKEVKVGNDNRQFIIRIPTKISDNTILEDFKKFCLKKSF